jgi:hypothetical protein
VVKSDWMFKNISELGFTLIRNLLDGRYLGGAVAALQVADALHNIKVLDNEALKKELILDVLTSCKNEFPALERINDLILLVEEY